MAMRIPPPVLLIMGVTGAGKSHFINSLCGDYLAETSNSLESCTAKVKGNLTKIGKTPVLLVDTPGFDDTYRSDAEILKEISVALGAQFLQGLKLKGVIFLHNIGNNRYTHSAMKTLNIFRKICGPDALKNAVLTTTHWDKVDEADGARRESELATKIWKNMIEQGARMERFYGDNKSALVIASQLLAKEDIVLDLQREIRENMLLEDTAAGQLVSAEVAKSVKEYEDELKELEETNEMLLNSHHSMREQNLRELQEERLKVEALQRQAWEQHQILRQYPAKEVNQVVTQRKNSASKFAPFLGPAVGAIFDVIGHFIGLPTSGSSLTSAFQTS